MIQDDEWKAWIKKLIERPDALKVFGEEYLQLCLKRGYSALRVLGYEGTSKEIAPKVVAVIAND